MSNTLFYSVCRYVPNFLRNESVIVGIVIHIPDQSRSIFKKTRNLSRIKAFDDEVELDIVKAVLNNMEIQLSYTSKNVDREPLLSVRKDSFLKDHLVFYVNQFQFDDIKVLNSSDVSLDIQDLCDMYLYYDKKKSERMSPSRVKSLSAKIFKQYDIKNILEKNPEYQNNFHQKPFDFKLNRSNKDPIYFKAFTFDYKKSTNLINEVKSVLYDINKAKQLGLEQITIVINNTDLDNNIEKQIYDELMKENVKVLTLAELNDFINSEINHGYEQLSLLN